jgi:hypothetical protein
LPARRRFEEQAFVRQVRRTARDTKKQAPCLFLSHSGADTEAARELKRRILQAPEARETGLAVWFDKDDLAPGGSWQEQIEAVITRRATAFAVLVGSKGIVNWVEREVRLGLARATGEGAIPLRAHRGGSWKARHHEHAAALRPAASGRGARYVLEGSVRKAGSRVRITGQLIDAPAGAHLWADRFEGSIDDTLDLQDQVTASVVGAIAST